MFDLYVNETLVHVQVGYIRILAGSLTASACPTNHPSSVPLEQDTPPQRRFGDTTLEVSC